MKFFPPRKTVSSLPSFAMQIYEARREGKRVLLVDDDELLREVVMQIPDSMFCGVSMVNTAGDAKQLMKADDGTKFAFVILDVGITNGDGIMLYAWIKDAFKGMPVLFLTNADKAAIEAKVREIGSAPIMAKTDKIYDLPFWQDLLSTWGKISWRKPQTIPSQ